MHENNNLLDLNTLLNGLYLQKILDNNGGNENGI